ncbi:Uncharacterized protein Fot_37506 [Forsythia ovata]|uniref:Uncharacterized protein n=1 Tax=Forsythia ovata TaxID=205694 RepID=A0ABD1S3B1_9LAMI
MHVLLTSKLGGHVRLPMVDPTGWCDGRKHSNDQIDWISLNALDYLDWCGDFTWVDLFPEEPDFFEAIVTLTVRVSLLMQKVDMLLCPITYHQKTDQFRNKIIHRCFHNQALSNIVIMSMMASSCRHPSKRKLIGSNQIFVPKMQSSVRYFASQPFLHEATKVALHRFLGLLPYVMYVSCRS